MKAKAFKRSLCALLTVLILVTLCPVYASAASFKLSKTSVSLTKGYSTTLKVTGTSKKPTWSTSNKKVATVTTGGKVLAKSTGTCYITAKVGSESAKCKVTVVNGKVTLSRSSLYMEEGDKEIITVTAIGSHSLKLSHSDKNIASASWSGDWDGNDHDISISAKKAGKATVKIYMSKYTSIYKTVTVNVSAASQDIDDTDDTPAASGKTSVILSDRTSIYLGKGENTTVSIYSDNPSKTTVKSSDTSIATISEPKWGTDNKTPIVVTAVKGGTTSLVIEASDNSAVKKVISVTVLSDGYYEISSSAPIKKSSTDTILNWNTGSATKYMLAPYGYDVAHTNSVFAKETGVSQYYQVYETSPAKIDAAKDVISTFKATVNGQTVTRYILLPQSYDTVRYNTVTAEYTGKFNYWVIYNVNPKTTNIKDTVKSWQASVNGILYTRYVLLPEGYSEAQLASIMNEDKNTNNMYYAVSMASPARQADSDVIYNFSYGGKTLYMLLPKNFDAAKRDTAVAKYTGYYDYYTIFTEKPETRASTDVIQEWRKVVDGKTTTRYMLLPAGYSADYFNSLKNDDLGAADVYYIAADRIPSKIESGDIIYNWYSPKTKTTRYMLLPSNYDTLKRNNLVYNDTGVYEYYTAYTTQPTADTAKGEQVFVLSSRKGTIYILVPADYDNDKVNAAVDEVNRNS